MMDLPILTHTKLYQLYLINERNFALVNMLYTMYIPLSKNSVCTIVFHGTLFQNSVIIILIT